MHNIKNEEEKSNDVPTTVMNIPSWKLILRPFASQKIPLGTSNTITDMDMHNIAMPRYGKGKPLLTIMRLIAGRTSPNER
jgi:hypothetical protein